MTQITIGKTDSGQGLTLDVDRLLAHVCVWNHKDSPGAFTWHVLLNHPGRPYMASLDAMPRYRYKSRKQAEDAARRMLRKLLPNAEVR